MLNPKDNRLDYGDILSPPNNYELDFAIGTTYSLDLDALVGASISLGLSAESDSDLNENPIFLLEALRSTGDKIALFCESGQIKFPYKPTPLYILLEEMVFQVINDNEVEKSKYTSFHPKTWLIRYSNDENEVIYRFIVLSRNLTFDRSWDLTFMMEGQKTNKSSTKNTPLIMFIEYLATYSTDSVKTDKISEIIEELPYIGFRLNSPKFEDFEFIVNGIDEKSSIKNQQLFKSNSLDELLIMTPFLSKDVLDDFSSRKNPKSKATLITRLNSLDNSLNLDNFKVYALKDEVIDGESQLSGDAEQLAKQEIHAKMYVVEKQKYTDLYLGSLNASHNALYGNVEFMIRISAKKSRFNIKKALKGIFNGDAEGSENPFQLVDTTKLKDVGNEGNNLNFVVKDIVRLKASAEVIFHDDKYNLEVKFEKNCRHDVTVRPLLSKKTQKFAKRIAFHDLDKTQLSEFFVICVKNNEEIIRRVIKVPVENMPLDRQKDVVSKVINDKTAFIRYVAFLLGDEYILSPIGDEGEEGGDTNRINFIVQLPELYEKMLKAAMYAPEKFIEIEFLIRTLSDDNVVPEGFEELYETFKKVIDDE